MLKAAAEVLERVARDRDGADVDLADLVWVTPEVMTVESLVLVKGAELRNGGGQMVRSMDLMISRNPRGDFAIEVARLWTLEAWPFDVDAVRLDALLELACREQDADRAPQFHVHKVHGVVSVTSIHSVAAPHALAAVTGAIEAEARMFARAAELGQAGGIGESGPFVSLIYRVAEPGVRGHQRIRRLASLLGSGAPAIEGRFEPEGLVARFARIEGTNEYVGRLERAGKDVIETPRTLAAQDVPTWMLAIDVPPHVFVWSKADE